MRKIEKEELGQWSRRIRRMLLTGVMEFWKERTADLDYGGYVTAFDRRGNILSREKNMWLHGRQTWMFSVLYHDIDKNPVWLELAKAGRDYMVSHGYAGNGEWNYLLDENGRVLKGHISLYTDMFALMGLSAYAQACNTREDEALIRVTYEKLKDRILDDCCPLAFPQTYRPGCLNHGRYMICLNAVSWARTVLGDTEPDQLIRFCMEKIFSVFTDGNEIIHELRTVKGEHVDSIDGHQINPGHVFEAMWFVLREAKRMKLPEISTKALDMIEKTYQESCDHTYGGILHMLDDLGRTNQYQDWNKERNLKWDEKVWWTHSEALCALLASALALDSREQWEDFCQLYEWCEKHFWDPQYGEWYAVLNRDGSPRITDKGGLQKSAFHVPRALYTCVLLLEEKRREVENKS